MAIIKPNNNTISAITALPFGTGKVLQVVNTTSSSQRTTNSTSFADSGLAVSITPSATSSKILIILPFELSPKFVLSLYKV